MDRPVPNPWRSWRRNQRKIADLDGVLDPVSFVDFGESITVTIAVVVVAVLIVFVLLPLLGVAFELIVLLALLGSGIVGRVALRRPWIIEATDLDRPEGSVAFAVKGWRRSSQAIDELARAISAAGPPDRLSEGSEQLPRLPVASRS